MSVSAKENSIAKVNNSGNKIQENSGIRQAYLEDQIIRILEEVDSNATTEEESNSD